ncbi:PD-(D/E)XK nuclease family protein, partial [Butyricicoccus sp. 1XD8-22]
NGIIEAEFHPEVTKDELSTLAKNAPTHTLHSCKTELYFKIPLSNEINAPFIQGYIDIVGENFIIDWKTNRVPYDVRENHQIGLYAWALYKLRGLYQVYGSLYFLRFKRESRFLYTVKEMEESRLWAYNLAKDIQGKLTLAKAMPELKDELFPATPSSFCSHCPIALDCFRKFSPVAKAI